MVVKVQVAAKVAMVARRKIPGTLQPFVEHHLPSTARTQSMDGMEGMP
jgi:hypothetical protein